MLDRTLRKNFFFTKEIQCVASYLKILVDIVIVVNAEYAFLIKYADDDGTFGKEKELNRWLRLVSNLVKPTLNLQLDVFFSMIRSVKRMMEDGAALECDKYMSKQLRRNYRQSAMSALYDHAH